MWRGPSAILPHGPTGPTPSGPPRLAPGRGWPRPGFPQGTATLAERVKDVQRILEIRLSFGATSGTLQLQPLAQAAAIVPDDAAERRKPGEFHSPRLAIAGFDHSSPDPTQAAGFDEHQDRFGPKKIQRPKTGLEPSKVVLYHFAQHSVRHGDPLERYGGRYNAPPLASRHRLQTLGT